MKNAWNDIKSDDYDAHMSHPNVAQTQMLNSIVKEQFELIPRERRSHSYVAVLGITNGNGLEHVNPCGISKIIGIDINDEFLQECRNRYPDVQSKLELFQLDLTKDAAQAIEILSNCELIIANLLIKHIHLDNFMKIISWLPKSRRLVSCVIQVNPDGNAVSHSGFEYVFDGIAKQRGEENEESISHAMTENGFVLMNRKVYNLPNGKLFIRLDYHAL